MSTEAYDPLVNLRTEEEAETVICPHRPPEKTDFPDEHEPRRCVGSKCMAWRFRAVRIGERAVQPVGLCGLSGAP